MRHGTLQYLLLVVLVGPPTQVRGEISIDDATIIDTLTIAAGETGVLGNTVTLDNGMIAVDGTLQTGAGTVRVEGMGKVLLNAPQGQWNAGGGIVSLAIEPGLEVLGQAGTSFATPMTTNRGVFAAIAGGTSNNGFEIDTAGSFRNEGVMEARDGGLLNIPQADAAEFNDQGTIRAQPGGTARLGFSSIDRLSDLGTVENLGGTIELQGLLDNSGRTITFTGGEWNLRESEVLGGTLATAGGGSLRLARPTLRGVTLNADVSSGYPEETLVSDGISVNGNWDMGWSILFDGDNVVSGTGTINSTYRSGWLSTTDRVVIDSGVTLRGADGAMRLLGGGTFELHGTTLAENGGQVQVSFGTTVENFGLLLARNDGWIQQRYPASSNPPILVNKAAGVIRAEAGGNLRFTETIVNEGQIAVDGGAVYVVDYDVTGPGSVSIENSLILSAGTTLSELLSVPRGPGSEYGTGMGTLQLEDNTLELADSPGNRFTLRGGTLFGGTITSADGQPLVATTRINGDPTTSMVLGVQLDADLVVTAGATTVIQEREFDVNRGVFVTGSGQFIVDGGRLNLGGSLSGVVRREQLERVVPISGAVVLGGELDNIGQTTTLAAGVDWIASNGRGDSIVGGRVEGEPGATLRIERLRGAASFRQGVTLALPVVMAEANLSVREGLTLDGNVITLGEPDGNESTTGNLVLLGEQTISGNGELHFNASDGEAVNGILGERFTIGPEIIVRTAAGSGLIAAGTHFSILPLDLTNTGLLLAENGHTLTLAVDQFEQRGTLRAQAGSTMLVHGDLDAPLPTFTNNGRIEVAGGEMQFLSNLDLGSDSTVEINVSLEELDAGSPILVNGAVTLEGLLEISFDATGETPTVGDAFSLLAAADGIAGQFRGYSFPHLPGDLYWHVDVASNHVSLSIADGAPAGDFDSDGRVDGRDLLVWQRDPEVGSLSDWESNYGSAAALANASSAVPEPSGVAMCVIGCLLVWKGRRCRRSVLPCDDHLGRIKRSEHTAVGRRDF